MIAAAGERPAGDPGRRRRCAADLGLAAGPRAGADGRAGAAGAGAGEPRGGTRAHTRARGRCRPGSATPANGRRKPAPGRPRRSGTQDPADDRRPLVRRSGASNGAPRNAPGRRGRDRAPLPGGKNEPGATRPVGVTEEHLADQKTARFSWVAPGTMRGALVASVVGAEGRLTQ